MASDERGVLGRSPRLLCNSAVSASLLPGLYRHPSSRQRLRAPPGVHEQVALQPGLQARSLSGCGRVSQQSQFVENTSAKIVSNHREAVIGALELGKEKRSESEPRGGGRKQTSSPPALPASQWVRQSCGHHPPHTTTHSPGAGTDHGDLASVPGPGSYP